MEKTIYCGSFTLASYWTVTSVGGMFNKITRGPTVGSKVNSFTADSVEKNAQIVSAKFGGTVDYTNGGKLTVGGAEKGNGRFEINVPIANNGGKVITYYVAAGSTTTVGENSADARIIGAYFRVTYTVKQGGGKKDPEKPKQEDEKEKGKKWKGSDKFPISPQACYIYDKDKKKTYMFDGVTKVAHSMTLKMEEEPKNEQKKDYVNNAKNEPNKVTFDVVMSDVYTSRDDLTNTMQVRSMSALNVLNDLKRSRRKVDVITNLMTYKDMLLQSLAITQDDTIHFGWAGQITFQEFVKATGNTSHATGTGGQGSGKSPSLWVQWFGTGFC